MQLTLTKHHGCQNDFLVVLDANGSHPLDPEVVVALCDRRAGIGADGVIRVLGADSAQARAAGADLAMELRNADGGAAEMSGNGMRALAQAAVRGGLVAGERFTVATGGGVRTVEFLPTAAGGPVDWASVDMGAATVTGVRTVGPEGWPGVEVDVGNPHLVVRVDDPADVDVVGLGQTLQREYADGVNVEFVSWDEATGAIRLRVFERGAGETRACGTGSCASVAAARTWGADAHEVVVHNPGGSVEVTWESDGVRLAGPVAQVARVEVDTDELLAAGR